MKRHQAGRRAFLVAAGSAATAALAGCLGAIGETERHGYTTPAADAFDAVVDGAWLEAHLEDVALLDVRGEDAFTESHVEGAHRLSETIDDHYEDTEDGYEASPAEIAAVLEDAGIARDDDVVVYGEETTMWATHGVYTLEAIGHEGRVSLLDGGFAAWEGAGGATAEGSVESDSEGTSYDTQLDLDVLATREHVADRVHEDGADVQLVDNRTPEEYTGVDESGQFERHGHIPGAVNVNFPQNFVEGEGEGDAGERFRSPDDLERLWQDDARFDPDEELVSYCTTGVRGSVGWFVATQLGWEEVRTYDGSWEDWGNLSTEDGYPYVSGEGSGTVVDTFGRE